MVPYFIASHPGSDLNAMIDLAVFLKKNGYKPDQVQDFIPAPFDIATCMYHTGLDPFTGEEVYIAKHLRDRKLQRAIMQFFKPENYFMVREALLKAGRGDLIGNGCDCLIPASRPRQPSWRVDCGRMRLAKATITIPSQIRRRESRWESAACRIRVIDRGGRRRVVRTRPENGNAAVVDRSGEGCEPNGG